MRQPPKDRQPSPADRCRKSGTWYFPPRPVCQAPPASGPTLEPPRHLALLRRNGQTTPSRWPCRCGGNDTSRAAGHRWLFLRVRQPFPTAPAQRPARQSRHPVRRAPRSGGQYRHECRRIPGARQHWAVRASGGLQAERAATECLPSAWMPVAIVGSGRFSAHRHRHRGRVPACSSWRKPRQRATKHRPPYRSAVPAPPRPMK
ncbi:hypothetical protein AVF2S5_19165 [Agrobacterium vitis]|nr:hypothetical protein [Agrobacterium vitis]UJL90634.1 hypothetical protein AVF2S5_19165 [Agrobacterium vitis]